MPDSTTPRDLPRDKPQRIASLDIFRGLNLALMIFVNELAEIKGLPWWTYHAPAKADVMTYVDMVFPGFLFIVGMSLPLALGARIRRRDNALQLVWYVVLRATALIVLGVTLANGSQGDPVRMHGLGRFTWGLLALLGAILIWFDYPKSDEPKRKRIYTGLRAFGFVLLVALAALFRSSSSDGTVSWFSYGYPEILGIIGYTYFVSALCYLLTRRWRWAPAGWFLAFTAFNIVSTHALRIRWPWWVWPVQNGSFCSLVFAGIVLCTIFFLEPKFDSFRKKAQATIVFGVLAAVSAYLLSPLGISKIRATPTWVLYTVAACCACYVALYWLCDGKGQRAWAAPVRSAGANTLLTYLLPDLWFYVAGVTGFRWWNEHWNTGTSGVLRSLLFTAAMLAISSLLTRMRFRLQL